MATNDAGDGGRRRVVDLESFRNDWFDPGRSLTIRIVWMCVSGVIFQSWVPWPSGLKVALLRAFGAIVGAKVTIKPRVNIKYPWNVSIGRASWIGEGVWIDSLGRVDIGDNCCVSQGVVIETGNHDWAAVTFDLRIGAVRIGDGAWAAVNATLLPGSDLATHAVLGAGSVLAGKTEPYCIYVGVPAARVRERDL